MMTHRNKKPYECKAEGCNKSYCDARSLRRHTENHHAGVVTPQNQTLALNESTPPSQSLSPATANGDASSPDGATCLRTYISNGDKIVDATTGVLLTEEQIRAINLPISTGVSLLSPASTTSNNSLSSSGGTTSSVAATSMSVAETQFEGEGLTPKQLDLISQIMQHTKQTSAQVTVSSPTSINSYKIATTNTKTLPTACQTSMRPRTWNMQLLNRTQSISITVDDASLDVPNVTNNNKSTLEPVLNENKNSEEISTQLVACVSSSPPIAIKNDQKPVECNLCHRKFKNIPALNGHMRLHGGYFKKDPETKKNEKKESSGPPLQTASIGVRALIEEKIISKRSKDLYKGAFVVPAPPGSGSSTTLRRSISDRDNVLNPKTHSSTICVSNNGNSNNNNYSSSDISHSSSINTGPTNASNANIAVATLPAATTIKSGNLSLQEVGISQSIELFNTKQQKAINNVSVGVGTSSSLYSTYSTNIATANKTMNNTTTKSTSTDTKDSTLIELLKRGTRVAVTTKKSQNSTNTILNNHNLASKSLNTNNNKCLNMNALSNRTHQIITSNNRTVIIPTDLHLMSALKSKKDNSIMSTNIQLADGTPVALTITNDNDITTTDETYTVTYSDDGTQLFGDNAVYSMSDSEMLLHTVDSLQFLGDPSPEIKTEHSNQFPLDPNHDVNSVTVTDISSDMVDRMIKVESDTNTQAQSPSETLSPPLKQTQSQTQTKVNNAPLPNFQQFHSKEIIMQTSAHLQALTGNPRTNTLTLPSLASPMHSPLEYPTPPSSHETVTQSSPFVDDRHNSYSDPSTNTFFGDKCNVADFLSQTDDTSNFFKSDRPNTMNENAFDTPIKVEDLLNGSEDSTECDLREFSETNLSFLDDDQPFLNDTRNAASPLTESFFTSGIGSAEEVKQVLRDVLPEENMILNTGEQNENIIDLYYMTGIGLQSQMMPNSDDPLLSSSPREFGQQRIQSPQDQQQQQQQPNQTQMQPPTPTENEQQSFEQQTQLIPDIQEQAQTQQQSSLYTQQLQATEQIVTVKTEQNIGQQQQSENNFHDSRELMISSNNLTTENLYQQQPQHSSMSTVFLGNSTNTNSVALNQSATNHDANMTVVEQPSVEFSAETVVKMEYASPPPPLSTELTTTTTATHENFYLNGACQTVPPMHPSLISTFPPFPFPPISATVISLLQPISNHTKSILKRRLCENNPSPGNSKIQSTYQSKLKKPSRTHYTPPPMLDPDRKGLGLYCSVRKRLNSGSLPFDGFASDDFSDHIGLVEFSDESKVNLGSDYQAQIPQLRLLPQFKKDMNFPDTVGSELMWDPSIQNNYSSLRRYIELTRSACVPLGSHSEETALYTLLKANGTVATAVLTLLQMRSNQINTKWSSSDLEMFFHSLEKYGKDFTKIAAKLGTKSTGDCVQMYYFWKKICVEHSPTNVKMEKTKYMNDSQKSNNNSCRKLTNKSVTDKLKTIFKHKNNIKTQFKVKIETTKTNNTSDCKTTNTNRNSSLNIETGIDVGNSPRNDDNSLLPTTNYTNANHQTHDIKPFVCEVPDCVASFTSKAALHGHTRIHTTYGKNESHNHQHHNNISNNNQAKLQATTSLTACSTPAIASKDPSNNNPAIIISSTSTNCTNTNKAPGSNGLSVASSGNITNLGQINKDVSSSDFPCRVCGK